MIGTFTLPAQATVEVRWASQLSTLSIGAAGLCVAQLRSRRPHRRRHYAERRRHDERRDGETAQSGLGEPPRERHRTGVVRRTSRRKAFARALDASSVLALACSEPSAPGMGEAYVTTIG